jgi:hypothetical protein
MTSLTRALLYVSLAFCGVTFVAPPAHASSVCAKKKKKKAKKAAAAPKKITAATLIKWRKSGMTDDEIVAKAQAADYVMSSKDKAALKKAKAKSLIAAFSGSSASEEEESVEVAAPARKAIDINDITNPEDIDFDSVPPPTGIPKEHVQKSATPEKKKLDTSVRPAAPFEEEKVVAAVAVQKKPASSSKKPAQTQSVSQTSADSAPKKRVVYTAAGQ